MHSLSPVSFLQAPRGGVFKCIEFFGHSFVTSNKSTWIHRLHKQAMDSFYSECCCQHSMHYDQKRKLNYRTSWGHLGTAPAISLFSDYFSKTPHACLLQSQNFNKSCQKCPSCCQLPLTRMIMRHHGLVSAFFQQWILWKSWFC